MVYKKWILFFSYMKCSGLSWKVCEGFVTDIAAPRSEKVSFANRSYRRGR